jgi:hypothetical protein
MALADARRSQAEIVEKRIVTEDGMEVTYLIVSIMMVRLRVVLTEVD